MVTRKILLFSALGSLLFLFIGCKREYSDESLSHGSQILSFSFKSDNNSRRLKADVICKIEGNTIVGIIPELDCLKDSLIASFTASFGAVVTVDTMLQVSDKTMNDYSIPLTLTVRAEDFSTTDYKIYLKRFTGLPIVYINTDNNAPIVSKDDYISAKLKIEANNLNDSDYAGPITIKGRGNSTWAMPKKPYKIKLAKKSEILGMPADKEWGLLANYADKSLIRNSLAFESSRIFGLPYTPRSKFVEVILNGKYNGSYLLVELPKIAPDRVNIAELGKNDIDNETISGGYRLEIDVRLDAVSWFKTRRGVPFTIKEPDFAVPEQDSYIKNYVQQTEDALYSNIFKDTQAGYSAYLDPDTFIKWYWVNELFKNNDAIFFSSVFMYKDRNKLLNMGPVWDFDLAAGNINYNNNDKPEGWWIKDYSKWISRLFEDSTFAQKAKDKWNSVKAEINNLPGVIDDFTSYLYVSQEKNFEKWNVWILPKWYSPLVTKSYQEEIEHLKSWIKQRTTWIDANIDQLFKH